MPSSRCKRRKNWNGTRSRQTFEYGNGRANNNVSLLEKEVDELVQELSHTSQGTEKDNE